MNRRLTPRVHSPFNQNRYGASSTFELPLSSLACSTDGQELVAVEGGIGIVVKAPFKPDLSPI